MRWLPGAVSDLIRILRHSAGREQRSEVKSVPSEEWREGDPSRGPLKTEINQVIKAITFTPAQVSMGSTSIQGNKGLRNLYSEFDSLIDDVKNDTRIAMHFRICL